MDKNPTESTRGWMSEASQPERALREFRREMLLPTRENQGKIGWVPCYISSVERLVLPVCRIWFLICSEGFSCQSLDVLKPNTAGPSSSSIFLAVGQGKVKKRKGEALNLPVNISHLQQHGSYTFQTPHSIKGTGYPKCVHAIQTRRGRLLQTQV